MKLRYYLRGLGIGILVTALILTIVPGEKEVLSDAEIRERAIQLGMVDSSSLTLADVQGKMPEVTGTDKDIPKENTEATKHDEIQAESNSTEEKEKVQETVDTPIEESPIKENPIKESQQIEEKETVSSETVNTECVTLIIKSGDSSYTVAKALQEVGLIEDARAFDTYLCDNGYSRSIGTGTYEIAYGTTEEEIAKIISRKR